MRAVWRFFWFHSTSQAFNYISFIDYCFNLIHENITVRMSFNYIRHTCGSSFDLGINKDLEFTFLLIVNNDDAADIGN